MKVSTHNLGRGAFLTSFIFLISFFAIHLLNTDFNFISKTYSDYVFGSFGEIVSLSLISLGISQLFLAKCLQSTFSRKKLAYLFILAGAGGLITGIFPTTNEKDLNLFRLIHIVGASIELGILPLGFIYLAKVMQKGILRTYFFINGCVTLFIFSSIALLFLAEVDKKINYFGLIEKIDILLLVIGLLVISVFISLDKLNTAK